MKLRLAKKLEREHWSCGCPIRQYRKREVRRGSLQRAWRRLGMDVSEMGR